jgi:hypothetical protein
MAAARSSPASDPAKVRLRRPRAIEGPFCPYQPNCRGPLPLSRAARPQGPAALCRTAIWKRGRRDPRTPTNSSEPSSAEEVHHAITVASNRSDQATLPTRNIENRPVLNGMTPADRNTAIRRLVRLLMEAAGADPEEIGDDERSDISIDYATTRRHEEPISHREHGAMAATSAN